MSPQNPQWPEGAVFDLLNMTYDRTSQEPEKMLGYSQVGTAALGGAVSGIFDYDEGTKTVACAEDGKVYHSTSGASFAQVDTGFTTTAGKRWSGAMFYGATTGQQLLVIGNDTDAPQKYTGSAVSALGGSPPTGGQYFVSWGGRLWCAKGDVLYASVTDNCESWTTGAGGKQFYVDAGTGDITGLTVFMESLIIFKKHRIYRLIVGSTLASAQVNILSRRLGCTSHWTIQECGGERQDLLMFLSANGVRSMYPTERSGGFGIPQADEVIRPIVDTRNRSSDGTTWASFIEDRDEYYLQYPTAANTVPGQGVIANTARHQQRIRWTRHNMANMSAGAVVFISGKQEQYFGDSTGKVWKLHVAKTYTRDGGSYFGRFISPNYTQKKPGRVKQYGRIFVDIETNGDIPVTAYTLLGRENLPTPSAGIVEIDDLGGADGWGEGEFGEAEWGGQTSKGRYVRLSNVRRGYYVTLRLDVGGAEHWFRVSGLEVEYEWGADHVAA